MGSDIDSEVLYRRGKIIVKESSNSVTTQSEKLIFKAPSLIAARWLRALSPWYTDWCTLKRDLSTEFLIMTNIRAQMIGVMALLCSPRDVCKESNAQTNDAVLK